MNDNSDLDFQKESIAISLWVYPVEGNGNPQFLLIKGDRSGNSKTDNYSLRLNTTENKSYLEFLTHLEAGTLRSVTSSFFVPKNQWSFVAVYYDYQNSKIYLWNDKLAVPVDTFNFTADLFPNDDSLFVGASGKNGFKRFWGRIDDLRIGSDFNQIMNNATYIEDKNEIDSAIPFKLYQNYPNPFNPATKIKFYLPGDAKVKLDIFNVLGEHISTVVNREIEKGFHEYLFNAINLPSGVYYYKLTFNNYTESKMMILVK